MAYCLLQIVHDKGLGENEDAGHSKKARPHAASAARRTKDFEPDPDVEILTPDGACVWRHPRG